MQKLKLKYIQYISNIEIFYEIWSHSVVSNLLSCIFLYCSMSQYTIKVAKVTFRTVIAISCENHSGLKISLKEIFFLYFLQSLFPIFPVPSLQLPLFLFFSHSLPLYFSLSFLLFFLVLFYHRNIFFLRDYIDHAFCVPYFLMLWHVRALLTQERLTFLSLQIVTDLPTRVFHMQINKSNAYILNHLLCLALTELLYWRTLSPCPNHLRDRWQTPRDSLYTSEPAEII